jgi:hypothetical protein
MAIDIYGLFVESDPYEFRDSYDDRVEIIREIYDDICGGILYKYTNQLNDIRRHSRFPEHVQTAKDLLDRLGNFKQKQH